MRRQGIILLWWWCALSGGAAPAGEAAEAAVNPTMPAANPPMRLDAIPWGEKLIYTVSWNGFPAGIIRGRVWTAPQELNSAPVARFELTIEGNDFMSLFYPVSATMTSFVNLATGASEIFIRRTREGKYHAHDRVVFDYTRRNTLGQIEPLALIEEFRGGAVIRREAQKIPGLMCDPISLALRLRAAPLTAGTALNVTLCDRYRLGIVRLQVTDAERITLPDFGEFKAWRLTPSATDFLGGNAAVIVRGLWLDQATQIILRAVITLPIGEVTVNLAGAENSPLRKK